jgi:hypothetical protein
MNAHPPYLGRVYGPGKTRAMREKRRTRGMLHSICVGSVATRSWGKLSGKGL